MIDFEQIGLTLVVKHDVKAQNVKAHRVFIIINLDLFEDRVQVRLTTNHGLDDDVFNFVH
jgi:hypothetical protein